MKALTLWQPWASLVAYGHKQIETRSWSTSHRGPLAIHAAKSIPSFLGKSRMDPDFEEFYQWTGLPPYKELPTGVIICIVDLVAIETTDKTRVGLARKELAFGNYEDGRYAWLLNNLMRLPSQIPAKGNRMLWNWEE